MAGRLFALGCRLRSVQLVPRTLSVANHGTSHQPSVIGNREVVGYGMNGEPVYMDRIDFPFPAVRWSETTPSITALREKEKGDWHKLTVEEKKALYRASFCQTLAELNAPTGEWKSIIGGTFTIVALGLWLFIFMKLFVYPPLPSSFSKEAQEAQMRRMLDIHVQPITGLSSEWDYEKDDWKKK